MFLRLQIWQICSTEPLHLIKQLAIGMSSVTSMDNMFNGASAFNQTDYIKCFFGYKYGKYVV